MKQNKEYRINTDFGILWMKLDNCKILSSVFMRFEEPFNLKAFQEKFSVHDFNLHSWKWNIHRNTQEDAMLELVDRLTNCGVEEETINKLGF